MNVHDPMIADALRNQEQYIMQLMEMPDSRLSKKLGNVRRQKEMAFEQQLATSLELLSIWERQIIEARFRKKDLDEPAAPRPPRKQALENAGPKLPEPAEAALRDQKEAEIRAIAPAPTQLALF